MKPKNRRLGLFIYFSTSIFIIKGVVMMEISIGKLKEYSDTYGLPMKDMCYHFMGQVMDEIAVTEDCALVERCSHIWKHTRYENDINMRLAYLVVQKADKELFKKHGEIFKKPEILEAARSDIVNLIESTFDPALIFVLYELLYKTDLYQMCRDRHDKLMYANLLDDQEATPGSVIFCRCLMQKDSEYRVSVNNLLIRCFDSFYYLERCISHDKGELSNEDFDGSLLIKRLLELSDARYKIERIFKHTGYIADDDTSLLEQIIDAYKNACRKDTASSSILESLFNIDEEVCPFESARDEIRALKKARAVEIVENFLATPELADTLSRYHGIYSCLCVLMGENDELVLRLVERFKTLCDIKSRLKDPILNNEVITALSSARKELQDQTILHRAQRSANRILDVEFKTVITPEDMRDFLRLGIFQYGMPNGEGPEINVNHKNARLVCDFFVDHTALAVEADDEIRLKEISSCIPKEFVFYNELELMIGDRMYDIITKLSKVEEKRQNDIYRKRALRAKTPEQAARIASEYPGRSAQRAAARRIVELLSQP